MRGLLLFFAACIALATPAAAYTAGERHLTVAEDSAAIRDAQHSSRLRITVWYPASADASEVALDVGSPGRPRVVGAVAPNADFADAKRRPVILFSHGFGGTARIMAWFGTALARAGFIVIAVDHPGNNGMEPMTVAGAVLFWERPGDLAAAWRAVQSDPTVAPHVDPSALGVAGYSAGGFTALAAAGARVDLQHFQAFCDANPTDGVCMSQRELALSQAEMQSFLNRPEIAPEVAHAAADLSTPGVKAVFAMAPALVQAFDPASLRKLHVPVSILVGDADVTAPPATNGMAAATMIPGANSQMLAGVAHYDFLADCATGGTASSPVCSSSVPRATTHATAVTLAVAFFRQTLGAPP